ncbi:cytochrome P450 9b2-like [Drosophila ficusphila]|uniref:cytochrome P450 9b2-like n=1 Tax=Drosophila ficusphila TaxID=30025 RepID=UPI0007E66738|nr:cytochrome P450 9b2-like [Drosophila ficusphila]
MAYLEIFLAIVGIALLIYKWSIGTFKTFEKRKLPYEKPCPFFGNMAQSGLQRTSMHKELTEFYLRTRHHKVVGFYNLRKPMVQINDPELIKKICVKDFDYFPNHQLLITTNERLLNDMVNSMKDQRWKRMRNTLTPVFTAAKMRNMFVLMNDIFGECMQHLDKLSGNPSDGKAFEVDMKVLFHKLTSDVIATTAFGLKVNSFENPKNEFYSVGSTLIFSTALQFFKFTLSAMMPKVFTMLDMKIFDGKKVDYFVSLVVDAMKLREEQGITRPDMIQLMMEAKKESQNNWTDDEIVAQCFIFFFAALDNNTNLISITAYELLNNPEIQERLYQEILQTKEALNGGSLTYDAVQGMTYMNMVISETLRKWTLSPSIDRVCSKAYTLTDEDGTKLFDFKPGDLVTIPIAGLHRDDRYFPEPRKFDPERFSEERLSEIVPFTYMPFGAGPRSCIANRFAQMQAKGLLFHLLLNYKVEASPRTMKDMWQEARSFSLTPKTGFYMQLVPRQ